jgi:hypothetical protein
MHDDDLSPEERDSLTALPRELDPPPELEARTVRALRARGLLRAPAPLRFAIPRAIWIGAAAASFALFAGGFALGSWLESRHTTEVVMALHQQDVSAAAATVQRTGSAYVSALAALAATAGTTRSPEAEQGREVAVNALHAAARQMVRLVPDDPMAVQILQGMERVSRGDSTRATAEEPRRVVWF